MTENVGHLAQRQAQSDGYIPALQELVAALREGVRGRVFLNADYDHEVIHADHIAGDGGSLTLAVIANGRAVSYPLHAVRFIDWGTV